LPAEIIEVVRELEPRCVHDLGGLVGCIQEGEGACQPVRRFAAGPWVDCALVGAPKRCDGIGQIHQGLRLPQLEQQLGPKLGRQWLRECASQRADRRVRRALRKRRARGRSEDIDDPALAMKRHRQDLRGDLLGGRVTPSRSRAARSWLSSRSPGARSR
jgi:hypothetical protein